MEILASAFMILLGIAIAGLVSLGWAVNRREAGGAREPRRQPQDANAIAASILVQVARLGGASADRAATIVREEVKLTAPVTEGIDIQSWAEAFARAVAPERREWLLDAAVRTSMQTGEDFPLQQYSALVDLSFALGFQTDALARLRARYNFSYEDHAKRGRPRSADRAGGSTPLFVRQPADRQRLLGALGLTGTPSRSEITSAYRRLAAQQHPDRFHAAPPEQQREAAVRFMEITEAYEKLLAEVDLEGRGW